MSNSGHLLPMAARHTLERNRPKTSGGRRDGSPGLPRPLAFLTWPVLVTAKSLGHHVQGQTIQTILDFNHLQHETLIKPAFRLRVLVYMHVCAHMRKSTSQ